MKASSSGSPVTSSLESSTAELISAVLLSRLLVTGEPLDDAFTQHLVDAVLLPALERPSPR